MGFCVEEGRSMWIEAMFIGVTASFKTPCDTEYSTLESANYALPVLADKVLMKQSHTHSFICVLTVYGCF